MKKLFILLTFIQLSLNCYSQVNFEKGYFYNNDNIKKTCLIKNSDWLNNPSKIEYKLSENSEIKSVSIVSISEFGVGDIVFKRFNLQIDKSSEILNQLSTAKNANYTTETLFLRLIVKGDLNLWQYINNNLTKYFYNSDNKEITQLLYKRYRKSTSKVGHNYMFKQQLINDMKCEDISKKNIENISYLRDDLFDLFIKYNSCKGIIYKEEEKLKRKGVFNINLRAGVNFNSFKVPTRSSTNPEKYQFDFGVATGYQWGIEIEYILPFKNNKWSVIIEPTFNNFSSNAVSTDRVPEMVDLNYKTFELPVGIRHYFFLNDKSKLFLNASYVLIFDTGSELTTFRNGFEFSRGTNTSYGLGFNYNDKYSIEGRYDTDRGNLFPLSNNFISQFTGFSIILGVNIL